MNNYNVSWTLDTLTFSQEILYIHNDDETAIKVFLFNSSQREREHDA